MWVILASASIADGSGRQKHLRISGDPYGVQMPARSPAQSETLLTRLVPFSWEPQPRRARE